MVAVYNKLKEWTLGGLVAISSLLLFIVLLPATLFTLLSGYVSNRSFSKCYKAYLTTLEGTKFFCYNNRSDSMVFIEREVLPRLDSDINVVFLEGRTPKSAFEQVFISKALYEVKDKKGFPYLLKVVNGEVIDYSINNEFFNVKNQGKSMDELLKKVSLFYTS